MFLEVSLIFTLLTVLNLWFVAFLRNVIRTRASQLVLVTDALRQEENSCLQLSLHPSPALNGDAILLVLQLERACTSVGCKQESRSSTGARLHIVFTHRAPTHQNTNGFVHQPGLILSSMHSGKFSTFACTRCSCATQCTRLTWVP